MATEAKIAGAAARAAGAEILAQRAAAEGEQVELFGLPVADRLGKVAEARDLVARGPGRPVGASSKGTKALREWLLARGVLPQAALMQWFQLGPVGFARALWGDDGTPTHDFVLEASKLWAKMGADLGRYFLPAMVPTDESGRAMPSFVVNLGAHQAHDAEGNALPPWLCDPARNQSVMIVQGSEDDDESKPEESK